MRTKNRTFDFCDLLISCCYRVEKNDEGSSVSLSANSRSVPEGESPRMMPIWRGDCFQQAHDHTFFATSGEVRIDFMTETTAGAVLKCIDKLQRTSDLIAETGHQLVTEHIDQVGIDLVLPAVREVLSQGMLLWNNPDAGNNHTLYHKVTDDGPVLNFTVVKADGTTLQCPSVETEIDPNELRAALSRGWKETLIRNSANHFIAKRTVECSDQTLTWLVDHDHDGAEYVLLDKFSIT